MNLDFLHQFSIQCVRLQSYNEGVNLNKSDDSEEKFVASMDVVNLFPEMKSEDIASVMKETVIESELSVKEMNDTIVR